MPTRIAAWDEPVRRTAMTAATTAASGAAARGEAEAAAGGCDTGRGQRGECRWNDESRGSLKVWRHRDPVGKDDHAEAEEVAAQTYGHDDDPGVHRRTSTVRCSG